MATRRALDGCLDDTPVVLPRSLPAVVGLRSLLPRRRPRARTVRGGAFARSFQAALPRGHLGQPRSRGALCGDAHGGNTAPRPARRGDPPRGDSRPALPGRRTGPHLTTHSPLRPAPNRADLRLSGRSTGARRRTRAVPAEPGPAHLARPLPPAARALSLPSLHAARRASTVCRGAGFARALGVPLRRAQDPSRTLGALGSSGLRGARHPGRRRSTPRGAGGRPVLRAGRARRRCNRGRRLPRAAGGRSREPHLSRIPQGDKPVAASRARGGRGRVREPRRRGDPGVFRTGSHAARRGPAGRLRPVLGGLLRPLLRRDGDRRGHPVQPLGRLRPERSGLRALRRQERHEELAHGAWRQPRDRPGGGRQPASEAEAARDPGQRRRVREGGLHQRPERRRGRPAQESPRLDEGLRTRLRRPDLRRQRRRLQRGHHRRPRREHHLLLAGPRRGRHLHVPRSGDHRRIRGQQRQPGPRPLRSLRRRARRKPLARP